MQHYNFDIFFSYSEEDIYLARLIVNNLRKAGFILWFAEEQVYAGFRFRSQLEQGLRESKHMISLITESYVNRHWTQREIDLFDISADHTERKIIGIINKEFPEQLFSKIDQVFNVYQRIYWKNKHIDYSSIWHIYCGIKESAPGPRNEWITKGKSLLGTMSGKTKIYQPKVEKRITEYQDLVKACLNKNNHQYKDHFNKLRNKLAQRESNSINNDIATYWEIGKPDYALTLILCQFPYHINEKYIWSSLDLGLKDFTNYLVSLMGLYKSKGSEVYYSWAISEQSWTHLQAALERMGDYSIKNHCQFFIDKMNSNKDFNSIESEYDYGVMITPWNHFHLSWLAIKKRDMISAMKHIDMLFRLAQAGDSRAARFINRISFWNIFDSFRSEILFRKKLNTARIALELSTLNKMKERKERLNELIDYTRNNFT